MSMFFVSFARNFNTNLKQLPMKLFLTVILCLIFNIIFSVSIFGQIENAGFENWVEDTINYKFPPFNSSTGPFSNVTVGFPNVFPVPGCESDTAVRMETVAAGGDTLGGVLFSGTGLFFGGQSGFPYAGTPDSLSICVRHDILPGDTAAINIAFLSSGSFVNFASINLYGTQTAWQDTMIDLPFFLATPDTVIIIMGSSLGDGVPTPGSWLEVDNLVMVGDTNQIPNHDFETVEVESVEVPEAWSTVDIFTQILGGPASTTKSTDAFEGNFSLRLETIAYGDTASLDTIGFITNGTFGDDGPSEGQPYTGPMPPTNLAGFYKYEPVGTDTAGALAIFTRYDTALQKRDTLALSIIKLAPVDTFDYFEIPVDTFTFSLSPDTFMVAFVSSSFNDSTIMLSNGTIGIGSALYLDALGFNQVDAIEPEALEKLELVISPNPASDQLSLSMVPQPGETYRFELFSLNGQRIPLDIISENKQSHLIEKQWDVSILPRGIYLLTVSSEERGLLTGQRILILR